jgi:hypothetical protein
MLWSNLLSARQKNKPSFCYPIILHHGIVCIIRHVQIYEDQTLLIPRSKFLIKKLIIIRLVMKFPAFHGTRKFTTVFTRARNWSLSQMHPVHPISLRSILTLSSHPRLGLPYGFTFRFPFQNIVYKTYKVHTVRIVNPIDTSALNI